METGFTGPLKLFLNNTKYMELPKTVMPLAAAYLAYT
jgi:hypothetical protein